MIILHYYQRMRMLENYRQISDSPSVTPSTWGTSSPSVREPHTPRSRAGGRLAPSATRTENYSQPAEPAESAVQCEPCKPDCTPRPCVRSLHTCSTKRLAKNNTIATVLNCSGQRRENICFTSGCCLQSMALCPISPHRWHLTLTSCLNKSFTFFVS